MQALPPLWLIQAARARRSFEYFVPYLDKNYSMQWFHRYCCEKLQAFEQGEIRNLMLLLPPQHGKSQLGTRLFPAWAVGRNPNLKLGIITYNDTFAKKFNKQIQRFIDSKEYANAFPRTALSKSKYTASEHGHDFTRNANQLEIVDQQGSITTVGRDGQITGLQIDLLILDDLYKDREEAMSMAVNQKIILNYEEVFKTRLHNDSQQLLMNTRWDKDDLAGYLLKNYSSQWEVIKFPALRTKDHCDYDPRKEGEALWEKRHSRKRILEVKEKQEVTFNSLYQQDPQPNRQTLVIKNLTIIPAWPSEIVEIFSWGLDFGFTNDPTALIKCGYASPLPGEVRHRAFFEELCYAPGIPMPELARLMREHGYVSGQPVYCDHALTNIEELRSLGILAVPAVKGEGSVAAGILKLNEYDIHVTAGSRNMIQEQKVYQYKTYGELITNEPLPGNDHAWDAARYNCYTRVFSHVG